MASPSSRSVVEERPLPPTLNTDSHPLKRLSLSPASATTLSSPSPHSNSPSALGQKTDFLQSPNGQLPPRTPIHRSPSSMSLRSRSATPTLLRKASMNSLHGVRGGTPSRDSPSSRPSSSHRISSSTMGGRSSLSETGHFEPPPPRYTAASIAKDHFEKELELHGKENGTRSADTIVILHDSVYGHRYSRPRTSKAALSTIVERPERIQASVLGLSVAYVRLGERHAEGQYALHPDIDPSTIPVVPFLIRKTTRRLALSSQTVTNVHGAKWMEELRIMCENAESRLAMNGKELTRPDMHRGSDEEVPKFHEGDLYLCSESLDAMEGALGAVCDGVDAVFEGSESGQGPHRTFVAIRPPGHHCSSSYPSGFCWLNNMHVGISHATLAHGLTHAAIIDFDLHHGDGSQAIAWEHNKRAFGIAKNALPWKKTSIGYFSLHDINSYPCEMGDEEKVKNASLCIENAHGQTIWNVHLQEWKSESEFWVLYEERYSMILEKARTFLRTQTERFRSMNNGVKAKGAIFISAGFDASEWESSGMQRHKVNVPTEFYARLTRDVVKLAAEEGTAVDGRVISVLEGGYSDRALTSGVISHLSGMTAGDPVVIKKELSPNGLGYEMSQKVGAFDGLRPKETLSEGVQAYDPSWWSVQRLEQLDAIVHPGPPPVLKKQRDITPTTYSSPTQSFIAKVTSPQVRRNSSSTSRLGTSPSRSISRAPSPPPPDVDWTVAAHELSKLLIPTDRHIDSCKPEDLSAEATRVRRERQAATPPTSGSELPAEHPTSRMSLRVRKPKVVEAADEHELKKPAPKTARRKTVAGAVTLAENNHTRNTAHKPEASHTKSNHQPSRRLSLISNAESVMSEATAVGNSRVPSNGFPPYRPGTSQTVRPESSISHRGRSIPPAVVKKPRVPSQPPAELKAGRVRKKSPLNVSGKAPAEKNVPDVPAIPKQHTTPSDVVLPSIETSNSQVSDIDSLTTGMRKIKLSLTTKAQRDAREQAAKEAAKANRAKPVTAKASNTKPTKPHPTRKPSSQKVPNVPILPPQSAKTVSNSMIAEPKLPENILPQPLTPIAPAQSSPLPAANIIPSVDSSTKPSQTEPPLVQDHLSFISENAPQNVQHNTPDSDIFIPYQPDGPPPEKTVQNKALQWLPPNTSTPKKADLPVFTSKSVIPFAPAPGVTQDVEMKEENSEVSGKGVDIWEGPETPVKK